MTSRSDSITQIAAHAIGAAISVGFLVWFATTASATEFGRYTLWLYSSALVTIPIDGGWRTLLTRETSRPTPEFKHLVTGLPRMAATHATVMILIFAPIALLSKEIGVMVLIVALTQAVSQFQSARYRGLGQLKTDAAFLVSFRTSSVVGTYFGYSYFGQTAEAAIAGTAAGQLPVLLVYGVRALQSPSIASLKDWLMLSREGVKFLSIDAATTIYLRSPLIFLGLYSINPVLTGVFAFSHRLIDLTAVVMAPIGVLYFNWIRRVEQTPAPPSQVLFVRVLFAGAGLGLGSWLGRDLISGVAVNILGTDYSSISSLIPFVSATVLFMALNTVLTNYAIAINQTNGYAQSSYIALCLMLVAAALLIPTVGVIGAAAATTVYEIVLAFKLIGVLKKKPVS